MRKTYRSLVYKDLDTYVMVNGQKTLIQFRGGSLQPPINGIYVSDDPVVIEAMDKDRGNGTSFICILSEGAVEAPKAEPKKATEEDPQEELQKVFGITNLQDAKNYLLKNIEGLTLSKMPNAASVKNVAAKNGIKFPELQ